MSVIVAIVGALLALGPASSGHASGAPASASPATTVPVDGGPIDEEIDPDAPPRPPPTVSDFFPEDANLSDCLGLVERPGCGSEARGGWRQTLVFVALAAGLALVFWRVSVGVRRNRAATPTAADD